jgi:hypothetical protein
VICLRVGASLRSATVSHPAYWCSIPSPLSRVGAGYADKPAVPKVIYKADETRRGFITAMLAPVNCRQEPRFGVRQTMWLLTLTFGTVAVMRLLLAH